MFYLAEKKRLNIKWIGLISYESYTSEEQEEIKTEIAQYNAYPVFVEKDTLDKAMNYYESVINPIFLNFALLNNKKISNNDFFQAYRAINQNFMATVLSVYKKSSNPIILFNDPYFLLSPKFAPDRKSVV